MNRSDFLIGLDLGQAQDYTALTILERYDGGMQHTYHLRHIERLKIGTPYPTQVARVGEIMRSEPLRGKHATLVIDQTGVGRPVVEMIRQLHLPVSVVAIMIHGGDAVSEDKERPWEKVFRVPKRDLVSTLQILLQSDRLKVAKGMPEAEVLVQELLNFKVKISLAGHDSYEAWREGVHDDLVLSAAMACWYGQYKPAMGPPVVHSCPAGDMMFLTMGF